MRLVSCCTSTMIGRGPLPLLMGLRLCCYAMLLQISHCFGLLSATPSCFTATIESSSLDQSVWTCLTLGLPKSVQESLNYQWIHSLSRDSPETFLIAPIYLESFAMVISGQSGRFIKRMFHHFSRWHSTGCCFAQLMITLDLT